MLSWFADRMNLFKNMFYKLFTLLGECFVFLYDELSTHSIYEITVTSLLGVAVTIGIAFLYKLVFVPLNRARKLQDVGYIAGPGEKHLSKKELANQVMKKRKIGKIPPVYPNGWFCIAESRDLADRDIINVNCLGLTLAVFRDEHSKVHAIDAHCPHMGANFAAGGRVFGDCVECPFHGWKFSGHDGKCKSIPYAEKIPDVAKVKSYEVLEQNRHVYIWYHAENLEPQWYPPIVEMVENGTWKYGGRTEHFVNAHIEEIPENGADLAHLSQVHVQNIIAGIDLRHMFSKWSDFTHHVWYDVMWVPMEKPNAHKATMYLKHRLEVFGKNIPYMFDVNVTAQQIGAGIVYLELEHKLGTVAFLQHVTPVGPLMQQLRHQVYGTFPVAILKMFMTAEAYQVERDIMIWNNKMYAGRPVFVRCKEDEFIAKHRRWYSQFYSENSPRLKLSQDTLDW